MNKKGQMMNSIEQLGSLIVPLIAVGIVIIVGLLIISQSKEVIVDRQESDFCGGGFFNTTSKLCCNETETAAVPTCEDAINRTTANLTYAYNATGETSSAISSVPGWLPIIVITFIGAVLIGLVAFFRGS